MSPGRALPLRHRSYWLMRQTKTLPPVPVPFADGSLQVVANPAGRWPFPTLSLHSLCRCLDQYPGMSPLCTDPFLPEVQRPSPKVQGARPIRLSPQSSFDGASKFRGCSHSLMFRPLHSLGPPAAPTAGFPPGRPDRLHRAEPGWLPAPGSGIATCPNRAIGMAGLSPAGMQPCRLLLHPLDDIRNFKETSHPPIPIDQQGLVALNSYSPPDFSRPVMRISASTRSPRHSSRSSAPAAPSRKAWDSRAATRSSACQPEVAL